MPTEVVETTTFVDTSDSDFMETGLASSLLSGPTETPEDEPAQEESPESDASATGVGDQPADDDSALSAIAEQLGVDLTNPSAEVLEVLRKIAERDKSQKPDAPAKQETETLEIDWADGLEVKGEQPPDEKPKEPTTEEKPETPAVDDIGKAWKGPQDAVTAENEALEQGDFEKAAQIREAVMVRYARGMILPVVEQMVRDMQSKIEQTVSQRFGHLLQNVEQDVQARQMVEDREFVKKALGNDPEVKGVLQKLFEAGEGVLEHNGQQFANTPYNQMLKEFPQLLNIRMEDENPRVAYRKTLAARFKAAAKLYAKLNQTAPKKAQALVQAGRAVEQRKQDERIRQGLNSGKGASTTGAKPPRNYAEELNDDSDFGSAERLLGRGR